MMRRTIFQIAAAIIVISVGFLCMEVPTDPISVPTNATVRIFAKDGGDLVVNKGTIKDLGLEIVFPQHLGQVTITSTCGVIDTSFMADTSQLTDVVYFSPFFNDEGNCLIIVHAAMLNDELKDRSDTLSLHVLPEKAGISFIATPQNHTLLSGTSDTMLFVTRVTGGAAVPATYTLIVTPQDTQELFTVAYSAARDTVKVLSALQTAGVYSITLIAASTHGGNALADTASCVLTVEGKIAPSVVHAPQQVVGGKADTLKFIVDNSGRPDPLTITLITDKPLDPALFTVVPTGADSIYVAVSSGATGGEATFGIITSNGITSDTGWHSVTIISPEAALWSTTTARVDCIEGKLLSVDLVQFIAPAHAAQITVTSSVGTVSGTIWNFTPVWGCAKEVPVTFTATKGDVALDLQVTLAVAVGDAQKPVLSLIDTALDGKVTSSSQITVECRAIDSGAGVASVEMAYGGKTVAGSLQSDNIYRGVITGLSQGVPTVITITATDSSRAKNSDTLVFTVTYDSTLLDSEGPVIEQVAGPVNGTRVKNASGTMSFTGSDNSGVDSVWWTLGGAFAGELVEVDGVYSLSYALQAFGENVITIHAKDASPNHTKSQYAVTLQYNTVPTLPIITSPAHKATGVEETPTFAWRSGDDADSDKVFYKVLYKKSSESGYATSGELSDKSYILPAATKLLPFTAYVWKVIAYTKTYADTTVSTEGEFTTYDPTAADGKGPAITRSAGPASGSRVTTASGTISFTVTDPSGVDSVWWTRGGAFAGSLTNQSGVYTVAYTELTLGSNVITVFARDRATTHNRDSLVITLVHNSLPTPAAVQTVSPQAVAVDVAVTPPFIWKKVSDADGDTLYYVVQYGTSSVNMTSKLAETRDTTISIAAAQKLDMVKAYYWQVVAYTKKPYADTVKSEVESFTTAGAAVAITTQPAAPAALYAGETLTLTVAATGTPAPTFQWYKDDVLQAGKTAATYTKTGVTKGDDGVYHVVVKNGAGPDVPSNTVTITVKTKVAITTDPAGQTVNEGAAASFTVVATGDPVLSYQWQKNGANVPAGGTGTIYSISAVVPGDAGDYRCIVKNSFSSDTSTEVRLSVTATPVYKVTFALDGGTPAIPEQNVKQGEKATMPASNPGKGGFEFGGWYKDNLFTTVFDFSAQSISGTTVIYAKWIPVYTVTYNANGGMGSVPVDVAKYKSGSYVTVLGKPAGLTKQYYDFAGWNTASGGTGVNRLEGTTFQIGSKNDTLYANWKVALPVITEQPVAVNPYPFDNISFSVSAAGIGLSYQWQKNEINLPTATSSTFAKQKVTYSDSGYYRCIVTNSTGSATSTTVKLAIKTTVKDADSNEYSIVVIGDQIWTVENLRTTRLNDGTSIPMVNDELVWTNLTTPGYCFYNYATLTSEQRKWGALYNWYTVSSGKLAPAGWRVATDDDWENLEFYLFDNGYNWDNSGFAPLKGGRCDGGFSQQGEYGYWWTSTGVEGSPNAWARLMQSSTGTTRIIIPINTGFSIRLIKD